MMKQSYLRIMGACCVLGIVYVMIKRQVKIQTYAGIRVFNGKDQSVRVPRGELYTNAMYYIRTMTISLNINCLDGKSVYISNS